MDDAPIDPRGTGFFVHGGKAMPGAVFLVTAKHVADKLAAPFVIRVNKKGGGAGLIRVERAADFQWCFHPTDTSADIAVAPISVPSWADARAYNADGVLDTDPSEIAEIGPGDFAYVVGLFHLHRGEKANLPIVHTGNVAMVPGDEHIPVKGRLVEGYLIQSNAISGCSGSPVLATRTKSVTKGGVRLVTGSSSVATLIGVWSSSWKVNNSEIVAVRTDDDDAKGDLAPLGMGIVTPASKLADILRGDELMRARQALAKRLQDARSATHDSLSPTKEETSTHREDFTRLLNAAVTKKQSAD